MEIVVATGGGFDPVHKGHIRLLKEAKKLGTKLIVILNSDEQLKKKKGQNILPFTGRTEGDIGKYSLR